MRVGQRADLDLEREALELVLELTDLDLDFDFGFERLLMCFGMLIFALSLLFASFLVEGFERRLDHNGMTSLG